MKKSTLYILIALLALTLAAAVWFFIDSRRTQEEMQEMVEQMTFEKEQLEEEYEDLAIQFDGYGQNIRNDSLAEKLAVEQQRVQDLLEELRITKATNARRIAELKKELATVRAVMVQYVHQIDSLDRTNKRLTRENEEVRQQYQQVSEKATQLEQERTRLTEVVSRASMMEVTAFKMTPLNKHDRKTSSYNKIQKLQIDFTIGKNITTEPGMKTVYLRLVRPDGEVMQKRETDMFPFENSRISFSLSQDIEYAGEEMSSTLYWPVEEILQPGTWNADFFIDGNLVGSFPFTIKK
ncbi:MAG: hypothetical protein IJV55_02280 [Paludibacteraceae bacterium]|nr:hypothetical protein [Paludibacteraceae bacterium]MBQ9705006.1 hypothetical protein [Paludibacteraceae bacterium]